MSTNGKELNSEFIDEVSTMLEKLKEKLGKCEGQGNSPLLNFDSCEDFPPKNETEVLNLISKLQTTLDHITKSEDPISQSGDDSSIKNTDSKLDSSESRGETPTVLSEDYEANSEDSTDDESRHIRNRTFTKEVALYKVHNVGNKTDRVSYSSSGSHDSFLELKKDEQAGHSAVRSQHSTDDAPSVVSLAFSTCKPQVELVDRYTNSSDGLTPRLADSESDEARLISCKKKRELPWKIRAAKKRMENLNKSENSINDIDNRQLESSKSTEAIHFTTQPLSPRSCFHSKSTGNIANIFNNPVEHQSQCLPWLAAQPDKKELTEVSISQDNAQEVAQVIDNMPEDCDDSSDSSDDEGEVFCVKPITANFVSQQEQQERKEKVRLPFEVRTRDVMKITQRFNKPCVNVGAAPLEKAPRKKVYGPINNNVTERNEVISSSKQGPKLSLPQNILSPKSDVPIIRGFPCSEKYTTLSNTEKKDRAMPINNKSDVSQTALTNKIVGNSKSCQNELNRENSSTNTLGYTLSKSKSSPVSLKFANRSGLGNWNLFEDFSHSKNTSLKPCFTSKVEKVKTNMVSDIQIKFKEQFPTAPQANLKADLEHLAMVKEDLPVNITEVQNIDLNEIQDVCDDPSILLFTPGELLKIAIHKAAINKQLSVDPNDKNIPGTLSVDESSSKKQSPLHQTMSLDCRNISMPISVSEILGNSENKDEPTICEETINQEDKIIKNNSSLNKFSIDNTNIQITCKDLKRRCFSESAQDDDENVSDPNVDQSVHFKVNNEYSVVKSPVIHNTNAIPKSYQRFTDSEPLEMSVTASTNFNFSKDISVVRDKNAESLGNKNTYSFLPNSADIPKFNADKSSKHSSRPILKRQKRQNSLEDAAQLLNCTVAQRKLKEDQVKKRSFSVNSYSPSSPPVKSIFSPSNIFMDAKLATDARSTQQELPYQNIIQPFIEENNSEAIKQPNKDIQSHRKIFQAQIEPKISQPIKEPSEDTIHKVFVDKPLSTKLQDGNNIRRGRSKSLFTLSNDNTESDLNQSVSSIKCNGFTRQFSDQGNIKQKSKYEKSKPLNNSSSSIARIQNNFTRLEKEPLHKHIIENVPTSPQNRVTPASPTISSSVLSSPDIMDQKKRKPNYTDFVVPPLPTSAHKISQLQSRPDPLSPTPSGTYSTGACSDKDVKDSQESDKLSKVSDTWVCASKNPNIITSSKPWANENNATIKGQFVKKNKDKLIQNNDNSTPVIKDSTKINKINHKSVKDYKDVIKKDSSSDTRMFNISKNSKIESKDSRIKDISNKFKIVSDSNKPELKIKKVTPLNVLSENGGQLRTKLLKNFQDDSHATNDSKKLTKPKPYKNERKNFISKICNGIFKTNNSTDEMSPSLNSKKNNNNKCNAVFTAASTKISENQTTPEKAVPEKLKISGNESQFTFKSTNVGPTINKLSKTNDAFKNIEKYIADDKPTSINFYPPLEKRKSGPIKHPDKWESKTRHVPDTLATSSWKISPSSQAVVKKNKNKLETDNGALESKPIERNPSSTEFKSVLSNFEQHQPKSFKANQLEKTSSPVSLNNTGIIRRQLAQFQGQESASDANFPLRLSKSCTFRHSSFEPFINNSPPKENISVIKHHKHKDSHSVKFSKIVEHLECKDPSPPHELSLNRTPTKRSRPKSLYSSSPDNNKCSIMNQFAWDKEVARLPLRNTKSESKVVSEEKRKKIEAHFKMSQTMPSSSYSVKQAHVVPKDKIKIANRSKTRIRSRSSSERSSVHDSWEQLVLNTDYNNQFVDELFSETILKDFELSESSLSRRRISEYSGDSNDGNTEVCVGPKLSRSKTFSHIEYRGSDTNVAPYSLSSYSTARESSTNESSKGRSFADHDKARKTLLKLATFDGSSSSKPNQPMNTYDEMVNQSSCIGKGVSAFNKFKQIDGQQCRTTSGPQVAGPPFSLATSLNRSASGVKDMIMTWCQCRTRNYKGVKIENFSTSWNDGLAFCALIHHFYPDAFDFDVLNPKNRRYNFALAFRTADERADIYPLLDVEDMVAMQKPDWKCVFTYVQTLYKRLKDE